MSERESMQYDVVIVGAGPAGLSAAIRLKQMSREQDHEVSVCVVEKGSEVGAHILSGAVLEPRALNELIPDWREKGAPLSTPVTEDRFFMFTRKTSIQFPTWMLPSELHNNGNYIISLGNLCRWLGQQAEALGVDIFPGFAASEVLFNTNGSIKGVATGDMGIGRDGEKTMRYSPGVELHAKYTMIAEGVRGSLAKVLFERFGLRQECDPQTFGLGVKELWEIDPAKHKQGLVIHGFGWPLDRETYGGRLPLSPGEQPGVRRLRHRAGLQEPVSVAVRGVPALQDPSGDQALLRGRPAGRLWRPGDQRGRAAVDPQAGVPRRHDDRLFRRFPQRAEDQGQPHRHEERRGGRRRPASRP